MMESDCAALRHSDIFSHTFLNKCVYHKQVEVRDSSASLLAKWQTDSQACLSAAQDPSTWQASSHCVTRLRRLGRFINKPCDWLAAVLPVLCECQCQRWGAGLRSVAEHCRALCGQGGLNTAAGLSSPH